MKKLVNIDMSWDEIKRRAKNGASLSVLADLNGVNTAVMREIVKGLEEQTGEKLQFAPKEKAIKKTMKKQKIDHQKVVEMYEAGKTVKEIAAEMETYDQNIYNHIAKYKKEKKEAEEMLEDARSFFAPEPVKKDKADWDADLAMIDVVMEQIMALEDELENLKKQAEPLNKQLNKWRKIKEAIENDTL
jgi:hypothetical protein